MNKDAEIEHYFTLWEDPFPFEAEYDHWVRRGKLLRVWLDLPGICDVPMNVEVVGDLSRGNKKGLRSSRKCVFRVLALDGFGKLGIRESNILSGFFHVLGKVKRREDQ